MPYPTKALDEYELRRRIARAVPPTGPLPPGNLRATAGDQQVLLTWGASPGATSYNVEQAANANGPWTFVATTSNLTYTAVGLSNGITYWFRVQGVAGGAAGTSTAGVSATPAGTAAVPPKPTVSALTTGDKSLSFTLGPSVGATSYQVFISTSTTFTTPETSFPATTPGQASGYSVTLTTIGGVALSNGTTYYVMARAVNATGVSVNSSPIQSGTPTATLTTFASIVSSIGYTHWWRCNETAGTSLDDESGTNELDAALTGTYTLNQTALLADGEATNKSITFTDATATTASTSDFNGSGNNVFSFWITYKRTGTNDGSYHAILEAPSIAIFYNDDNLFVQRYDATHEDNLLATPPAVGSIEHILVRYDSGAIRLNRNGSVVGSTPSLWPAVVSDGPLRFGQGSSGADEFEGQIDEVIFWNFYIDDTDALRLYQAAAGTTPSSGGGSSSDLHEAMTPVPSEISSGTISSTRSAILATPAGGTYSLPDGIYRLTKDQPSDPAIHIPAGVKVTNPNKRAWVTLSRNWATGGEAGNTWSGPTSGYWTSSRTVPAIGTSEPGGVSYFDAAKAQRYEMCVGITSTGVVTRFASIAAGGTPAAGQFCFTSSGTRTIRLGTNPANFTRIEVVEATAATGRFIWPDGNGVTVDGIVFRYAPSGPSGDPMGSHDKSNFTITNCVVGDCHGTAVNCGGSNNVVITDTLVEYAGNTGITTYNVHGLNTSRNHILYCGDGGWDVAWQGGATKFTVTTDHRCYDNIVANCTGDGLWWDVTCVGPIYINGNFVHHCTGPVCHYEVSSGPVFIGTERGNCFAYNTGGGGSPVLFISSSAGPGEIANNLIIANAGRGLQVEWTVERTDDIPVTNWYWHDNRYIIEHDDPVDSDAIWVNDAAGAPANNNRGSNEKYYFGIYTPRWLANSVEYTNIDSWNGTPFDENGQLVSGAVAAAWRAAWGI